MHQDMVIIDDPFTIMPINLKHIRDSLMPGIQIMRYSYDNSLGWTWNLLPPEMPPETDFSLEEIDKAKEFIDDQNNNG